MPNLPFLTQDARSFGVLKIVMSGLGFAPECKILQDTSYVKHTSRGVGPDACSGQRGVEALPGGPDPYSRQRGVKEVVLRYKCLDLPMFGVFLHL